ncbi:ABC transporter ATP-binding protein [Dermacoccus nishinomiyaensis]|uniref:ABC transporter ATP-binding protein n=2 Tax=Dermacoccus TaxID=57495 RepID=A0A075JIE7_9MICO|nr:MULTISPECIES: ABC transporter ATP-binding protein [Dermacoccus]HCQ17963.1 ABC transporter ATP-binding protein [Dermacoccus sp.]AIF41724.1 ABC transporter ATP-binding protein [Dermacoccus nishinomiyaensis]MCT1605499.1 ABC transporter ATP-binding protein [Dermacoccus nishinomiyaensis]PZP00437.1 MAG: ABC transporter ATP-binding protein [Dermacoccus nishinomiyaensis]QQY24673.1 ABC transporter ATP-binding protein [Dermacoccus nishinomiyaensis]
MSLDVKNATLTFPDGASGRITAVNDVSLHVAAGEFAAVTGPSGSGKSSLLAVAGLLQTPDSGIVTIDGKVVSGLSHKDAAAVRLSSIGFVFQQSNLIASLTSVEQLEIVARIAGRHGKDTASRAEELLAAVGLEKVFDRRPAALSGGQRQRVGIARALMNEPKLLLVDEPTASLDTERGTAVVELLGKVTHEHQAATIMVTHDLHTLDAVDSLHEMVDGRLRTLEATPTQG